MPKSMLIDASHPEETRVVVVNDRQLEEHRCDFRGHLLRPRHRSARCLYNRQVILRPASRCVRDMPECGRIW